MSIRLTPYLLEATYTYLRSLPPANRWALPEADEIQFHVMHARHFGDCGPDDSGEHVIRISSAMVHHLRTLQITMGHEMTHLYCQLKGIKYDHGKEFQKCARRWCKTFDCDPGEF